VIDYRKELNKQQYEAIIQNYYPQLVIAGAGSGKTRTLTYKVAYLIESNLIKPERILLLTFTRKAAREMMERASYLVDNRCANICGGTFHSYAASHLFIYAEYLGFKNRISIIDPSDAALAIGKLKYEIPSIKKDKHLANSIILGVISNSFNTKKSLKEVVESDYPNASGYEDYISKVETKYRDYKFSRSLLDYDDLLFYFRKLLQDNKEIKREICSKIDYILVDEYQDTNTIQADIVYLLSSEQEREKERVMVVGDDSQCIYTFRGATFDNIMNFPQHFPACQIIKLEQNYRSTQPILSLANEIIRSSTRKYDKNLFTELRSNNKPTYYRADDEQEQASYVCNEITNLLKSGSKPNDIAVLFRSGNNSSLLEVELTKKKISFVKYGGWKFLDFAHVRDVLSFLRVIVNYQDELAWHRVLPLCPGIGEKTTGELTDSILGIGYSALDYPGKKYSKDLLNLKSLLEKAKNASITETLDLVIDYYKPILNNNYPDAKWRYEDLLSLKQISSNYSCLDSLLADLVLDPITEKKENIEDKIILSTVHSAKGLEWKSVFIISLTDGSLPIFFSFNKPESVEEERRIFYVAITRAKENLHLVFPQVTSKGFNSRPSRFLTNGALKLLGDKDSFTNQVRQSNPNQIHTISFYRGEIECLSANSYVVQSESDHRMKYKVNLNKEMCDCPFFRFKRQQCKHIRAAKEVKKKHWK
jgi:DNA helicase II / ATP-dependent DNA helicase PcrA